MPNKKKEEFLNQTVFYPKTYIKNVYGDYILNVMPHSEVCMHLRVAGRIMGVRIIGHTFTGTDNNVKYTPSAQLINPLNGKEHSFPISLGEAGIFSEQIKGLKKGCYRYYYYACPKIGVAGGDHVS